MSAQRLGDKKLRRLRRDTGLPIIRAWAHGGYMYDFVTQGHLHGVYDMKTGEWRIYRSNTLHYDTCRTPEERARLWPDGYPVPSQEPEWLFPEGVPEMTLVERTALEHHSG